MLNKLWISFFVVSFITAVWSFFVGGDLDIFNRMVAAIFEMSKLAVEIAIGLIGILAFWCGLLKLAEKSGIANGLARVLAPLFSKLMPGVPPGHPALGYVTMNMASNMLGLDNAATPVGLKAMESLQSLNPIKDTASNAQILFLVLNTSSVTIFPITIVMYRLQQGASAPSEVFIPIILATSASTFIGLLSVAIVQRINLIDRTIAAYGLGLLTIIGGLIYLLVDLPPEQLAAVSAAIGNGLLLSAIVGLLLTAHFKRVLVYDNFVEGAKEGFDIAVKIIPFMVAMLVAIGVLRASGVLEALVSSIGWFFSHLGVDTQFIDALPTALMNPLSGSGARAMMLETMNTHGVDSFAGRLSSIMQGSTETTFYVLAVYFGAVGIKKVRHAIGCGLIADLAGITAAIFVAYWFF